MTFRQWASVGLYTSSCDFAQTCVFSKQSADPFHCGPNRPYDPSGHPFSRSYGAILPSSLTEVLPSALGYSPRLPVLVCGTDDPGRSTEAFLVSGSCHFSQKRLRLAFGPIPVFDSRQASGPDDGKPSLTLSAPSPLCFKPSRVGARILTCHPSPTPFGLGLGSD